MKDITYVYLIRHAEQLKEEGIKNINENSQISNEKIPLSVEGEKQAENISRLKELNNIDTLWSSNYVRAISTAKYIAFNNKIDINIDVNLNERRLGDLQELRILGKSKKYSYTKEQLLDENLKNIGGENRKEVTKRMEEALNRILSENNVKKIAIVSHGATIKFLLMKWCKLNKNAEIEFKNKVLTLKSPGILKLIFENKELLDIMQVI